MSPALPSKSQTYRQKNFPFMPSANPKAKNSLFARMTAQLISCYVGSSPALYPLSACTPPLPPQQLQSCATPNYSHRCQAGGTTATEDGSRVQSMTTAAAGGQNRKGQITVYVITVIYLKSGRRQSMLCLSLFLPSVATEQFPKTLQRDVMHLLSIVLSNENHCSQSR